MNKLNSLLLQQSVYYIFTGVEVKKMTKSPKFWMCLTHAIYSLKVCLFVYFKVNIREAESAFWSLILLLWKHSDLPSIPSEGSAELLGIWKPCLKSTGQWLNEASLETISFTKRHFRFTSVRVSWDYFFS